MKKQKFRHELKHYINISDYFALKSRLKHIARLDRFAGSDGTYKIRSLYFDNPDNKALMEKINGINNREKFRIRFYNDDPSFIKLEKKSKVNGLCTKKAIDISFLFWAISAGLIPLAIFGSLFIGVIMVVFVNKKSTDNPYILVIRCDSDESERDVMDFVSRSVKKYVVKSKTVASGSGIELTVEIRLKDMSTKFVNEISHIAGVNNAVLVSYNGEYMS